MTLSLYHLPNSRSQRIVWLFEELQLNYKLIIDQPKHAPLIDIKYPSVHIHDATQNIYLSESSAIAEYFCQDKQRLLIPQDQAEYLDFIYYKNFADASLMPNLALKQTFRQIANQTPWIIRFVSLAFKGLFNHAYLNPTLLKQLEQLNQHLSHHTWLAGEHFSYADILAWFPIQAAAFAYPDFSQFESLQRYLLSTSNRPAFQTACLRGHWSAEILEHYWSITR